MASSVIRKLPSTVTTVELAVTATDTRCSVASANERSPTSCCSSASSEKTWSRSWETWTLIASGLPTRAHTAPLTPSRVSRRTVALTV